MKRAKIFKNGQSQAVRLPKEFRFEGEEVFAQRLGKGVLLLPADSPWEFFLQSLDLFSNDFMEERQQLPPQKRENL